MVESTTIDVFCFELGVMTPEYQNTLRVALQKHTAASPWSIGEIQCGGTKACR